MLETCISVPCWSWIFFLFDFELSVLCSNPLFIHKDQKSTTALLKEFMSPQIWINAKETMNCVIVLTIFRWLRQTASVNYPNRTYGKFFCFQLWFNLFMLSGYYSSTLQGTFALHYLLYNRPDLRLGIVCLTNSSLVRIGGR